MIVAFAPAYNAGGRRDATGAFQPEADAFLKYHGRTGNLFLIDNRKPREGMRKQVLAVLRQFGASEGIPTVAFFCHGQGRRIQLGWDVGNVDQLARTIARMPSCVLRVRVVLYTCNAAMASPSERYEPVGGDGGFADALRDALCRAGCLEAQVDGHTTVGHTTRNPYVRRFEGRGSPVGGVGGYMLVAPGTALWPRWRTALRETSLRYEFPFLSVGEIHKKLVKR